MPESLPLPFLDDHLPLFVNSHISYREEDFGTYINSGSYVRLVTKDSADLLRSLSKGIFNLREIVQNYNLDIETTRQFFAALIKEEFVVFEQSEDDALVSPFC